MGGVAPPLVARFMVGRPAWTSGGVGVVAPLPGSHGRLPRHSAGRRQPRRGPCHVLSTRHRHGSSRARNPVTVLHRYRDNSRLFFVILEGKSARPHAYSGPQTVTNTLNHAQTSPPSILLLATDAIQPHLHAAVTGAGRRWQLPPAAGTRRPLAAVAPYSRHHCPVRALGGATGRAAPGGRHVPGAGGTGGPRSAECHARTAVRGRRALVAAAVPLLAPLACARAARPALAPCARLPPDVDRERSIPHVPASRRPRPRGRSPNGRRRAHACAQARAR